MMSYKKAITSTALILAFVGLATASAAEMTIFPEESSTRIDSFTSYEVQIENVGPVEDVYTLSSNSPREVTIAPTRVPKEGNLAPGETKTVNVWYNPGEDKKEGRYPFSITATSRASGDRYSVTGYANVITDYKVNLQGQTQRTVCLGEQARYEIQVTNDGIQEDKVQLETDYGELSQQQVSLEPEETKTVVLTASADEEVQENFNVRAASQHASYADARDTLNMQFNTEICFDSEVSITPEQQDVAAFTEAEYDVTVRNTGVREDSFVLSSNIGELEQTELQIPGTDSSTTSLTVTPEELDTQEIEVTAESRVTSTGTAEMNVYNGMDLDIGFGTEQIVACEEETVGTEVVIENTGEAAETYSLEAAEGELSEEEFELQPGNTAQTVLEVDTENYELGEHELEVTGTAQTFGEPSEISTTSMVVENCWDLELNVIPEVASAGENRSTIYEIHLDNPGTRANTYEISYEGPDWISIRPDELEVQPGEQETAYMYAGAPFQKQGEVEITVTATGTQVERSETVRLVVGDDLEEAIRDDSRRNGITGAFTRRATDISQRVTGTDNLSRVAISVIVGLLITAFILYREW